MTELNYGDKLQVGDKVKVRNKFRNVFKVNEKEGVAYVRMTLMCTLELPIVYSPEFKSTDEFDETSYEVYRDSLENSEV